MKILYITPYAPTPVRTRPFNLILNLVSSGNQVTLATVWENESERLALCELSDRGVEILAEPLDSRQITINLFNALRQGRPLQANYSYHPVLAKRIVDLLISHHSCCDIIHIEHLRGAVYGLAIKQNVELKMLPTVWDSVDNISSLFEDAARSRGSFFGRRVTRFELPRTQKFEKYLTNQFERTLVTSPVDKQAFAKLDISLAAYNKIEVLTNGVDLSHFYPDNSEEIPDSLVFSGKLSYHANVSSALYLVDEVMPLVWSKRPQVTVWFVGQNPDRAIRQRVQKDPRLVETGTVPNIRPYLNQASIAVAPLTYGAGVQNKVLEAMACSKPVVATPIAVSALQAIAGRDLLVGADAKEFANHLLNLLENKPLRHQIGEHGRTYVGNHHHWNSIVNQLVAIYEDIIQTSRIHESQD